MTLNEFLYDHDEQLIGYLLNQHIKLHGLGDKDDTDVEQVQTDVNPREFFIQRVPFFC